MNVSTRSNSGPLARIFGPIIFVLVGIGLFFLSSYMTKRDSNVRARCTEQVEASVVSFERSDSSKSSDAVTPVFEYEYNGRSYTSSTGSYSSTYKDKFVVGQKYTVYVDPNDPQEMYSEDIGASDATMFKILKWGGLALAVIGVISFIFSIVKLVLIGGAVGFAFSEILKRKK